MIKIKLSGSLILIAAAIAPIVAAPVHKMTDVAGSNAAVMPVTVVEHKSELLESKAGSNAVADNPNGSEDLEDLDRRSPRGGKKLTIKKLNSLRGAQKQKHTVRMRNQGARKRAQVARKRERELAVPA